MEHPIGKPIFINESFSNSTTGRALSFATPPSFAVYEEDSGSAKIAGSMKERPGVAGCFCASFTPTKESGFTVGKSYTVVLTANLGNIVVPVLSPRTYLTFQLAPAGLPLVTVGGYNDAALLALKTQFEDVLRAEFRTLKVDGEKTLHGLAVSLLSLVCGDYTRTPFDPESLSKVTTRLDQAGNPLIVTTDLYEMRATTLDSIGGTRECHLPGEHH